MSYRSISQDMYPNRLNAYLLFPLTLNESNSNTSSIYNKHYSKYKSMAKARLPNQVTRKGMYHSPRWLIDKPDT